MKTETTTRDGVHILTVSDHVSSAEVESLVAQLGVIRGLGGSWVIIDLADLKNLPTAVIGALIAAIRELEDAGGRLVLASPNTHVRVTLDQLGVAPMVSITEGLNEALVLLKSLQADRAQQAESTS